MKFDEVVESIDELTLLEQIKLKELLTKRIDNVPDKSIIDDISASELELSSGVLKKQSIDEIMKDIVNGL